MTFKLRQLIYVAVISFNLFQVFSQTGPSSSVLSPKYEILGKYEVAAPDKVS